MKINTTQAILQKYGTISRHVRIFSVFALLITLLTIPSASLFAQDEDAEMDLLDLDLDALVNMEVTSVSKKAQKITDAPAAISVIRGDDIIKAGALTIPDALRLIPGMQVGQINSGSFAVTSRGFNNQFANKLLVLIDGRSVYTPLFSGVYWDMQNVMMEDLDRIEVIRGPGATVWGANAVNGVINIVTKSAKETQGTKLYGGAGTMHEYMGGARFGGKINESTFYRIYGIYKQENSMQSVTGVTGRDNWDLWQGGVRLDSEPNESVSYTLQSDVYHGTTSDHQGNIFGANFMSKYQRRLSEDSAIDAQAYWDRTHRKDTLSETTRDILDLEIQYSTALGSRNSLISGVGYRFNNMRSSSSGPTLRIADPNISWDLFSFFAQNDTTLIEDKLTLTLGTKIENNGFTGWEIQPSARLAYKPAENQTVWASASRAVRTPSEVEGRPSFDLVIGGPTFDPALPGLAVPVLVGTPGIESESLFAYELGYRIQPTKKLNFDLAAFFNLYDEALSLQPNGTFGAPSALTLGLPAQNRSFQNVIDGSQYGIELASAYAPLKDLQLRGSYSFMLSDLHGANANAGGSAAAIEATTPVHVANLQANYAITRQVDLTGVFRYMDDVSNIDAYVETDLRVAYRPIDNLEISVTGRNLLDTSHPEYNPGLGGALLEVPRSVFGWVSYSF